MNKWFIKTSLSVLVLCLSVASWAGNPCMPIAEACMKEGYYKGGESTGKGLVKDCVQPVVTKSKTLVNMTFTDEMLQQCAAMLAEKMQNRPQATQ